MLVDRSVYIVLPPSIYKKTNILVFAPQLKCAKDGFSVIADYFGRGVFNKLTLITDPFPGRAAAANIDAGLQRDLLMHSKSTA